MTEPGYICAYRPMHEVPNFITVSVAPASEPVTTAELKTHLRVDGSDEDTDIELLGVAARELVETDTERALMPQTLILRLDAFPDYIELRRCPLRTVTSIQYYDSAGTLTTLAADQYRTDLSSEPGRIAPAWGVAWPTTRPMSNAVIVTFTAGYDDESEVPAAAKHAIKLLVGHWYRNREAIGSVGQEIELSYGALIQRLRWGGYV